MAAPKGNKHATKARIWTQAIERALNKRSKIEQKEAIEVLAEKLLAKCDEGDMTALKELGDRLEGKPTQIIGGDPEQPLIHRIERSIVDPQD